MVLAAGNESAKSAPEYYHKQIILKLEAEAAEEGG
jgi:hypothetical protein